MKSINLHGKNYLNLFFILFLLIMLPVGLFYLSQQKLSNALKTGTYPVLPGSPNPSPTLIPTSIPTSLPSPTPTLTSTSTLAPSTTPTATVQSTITQPPQNSVITFRNIRATGITTSGTRVSWMTDIPGTSRVVYGTASTYLNFSIAENTTLQATHVVYLNNLSRTKKYYYRVISKNSFGDEFRSSIKYFETK